MRPLGIFVDRTSTISLQRQLEAAFRTAIISGSLAPGERILSSRELQRHLGVSRNTVTEALAQLLSEGYLASVRGVGTFVAANVNRRQASSSRARDPHEVPSRAAAAFISAQPLAANMRENLPFRPGLPALDLFPFSRFRSCFHVGDWETGILDYPEACGHHPLRDAIAKRLAQTRGVTASPDQIVITGGAQAAFSLIASVLLKSGDATIIEEPGYPSVRAALMARGVRLLPVPVDEAGIDVSKFRNRPARLAYVTPSHQYPTGAVLTLERRFALLDWAQKHDAWIVEDDYDSEFNYTGRPQPALQGLGDGRRVVYVGTFSKVLSPALRIAYVVVPRALKAAFEAAHQVLGGPPDAILQAALARFLERGHLGRHIAKMRRIYDERRAFVSAEFLRSNAVRIRDSRAGLHFIAEFSREIPDATVTARAAARGIVLPALSSYFAGKPSLNGVVVGYAATSIARAKNALAEVAFV